jgi:dihydroorotate dehydrogenase (NAD+) catalytic subunit
MNRLETELGDLVLKSPIMTAAGCAGHSNELSRIEGFNFSDLGAFVTKGVTLNKREGNPQHRIAEVSGGMLNSIGLQNEGLKYFMEEQLPKLEKYDISIIVNIAANSIQDFEDLCYEMIEYDSYELISGVEINLSCPNVAVGGLSLGVDPLAVEIIVQDVKNVCSDKLVITKLTPNITDIVEIAEAAIEGGTDALSMINTVRGCAVDIENKKFVLGRKFGGLSGPVIKPIGLLAVHECFTKIPKCKNREIPIIGVGGIITYRDVLEYIMIGASGVGIGTGLILNSNIFKEIKRDLEEYLEKEDTTIKELVGIIE